MYPFKKLIFISWFFLFALISFANGLDKSYLVFKVNNQTLLLNHASIKTAHLAKAGNLYHLVIELSPIAAKKMAHLTAANRGEILTVLFNGQQIISKAVIQSPLGAKIEIPNFPIKEGQALINTLKYNLSH